jgi:hypothetical protein
MARRDERGSVLVVLLFRDERGSVLVVLLLRRAVLGTGVAAVSPVVTTVAGEVTADVLMTSL